MLIRTIKIFFETNFQNWNLYISDDDSTDQIKEIISDYIKEH